MYKRDRMPVSLFIPKELADCCTHTTFFYSKVLLRSLADFILLFIFKSKFLDPLSPFSNFAASKQ